MKWQKLGRVFCPSGNLDWMHSHAANPVAEHLDDDLFRIYFSPRDKSGRSQICSLLMRLRKRDFDVFDDSVRLELTHGQNGYFDDSGVTVTGLLKQEGRRILYFLGWNLGRTIPFRNSVGAAISKDGESGWTRISNAPIIDRNPDDPISISYPFILQNNGRYLIWYGSSLSWEGSTVEGYVFSLKFGRSNDGLSWERTGDVVLGADVPQEDAIARPSVLHEDGIFKMWYSLKKGRNYRLGYAESFDGVKWKRKDDIVGLDVSHGEDWDSQMVEYPFVFDHEGERYMLYNGNDYGRTGFGLAVLEMR